MDLGEKIRAARTEAGLSQRQLCGEAITRNMLSQIEHGTARPSMGTLKYLADRLGKPMSFFLEEDALMSPNAPVMDAARGAFDREDWAAAREALEDYRAPDPVYDRERQLLEALTCLKLAEKALREDRKPYARQLLEGLSTQGTYCREDLERRRLLLLAELRQQDQKKCVSYLPSLDRELRLRAEAALTAGLPRRASELLAAMEGGQSPADQLLRGRALTEAGEYGPALRYLHNAERTLPLEAAPWLERCYKELEDYKKAYYYACLRSGR